MKREKFEIGALGIFFRKHPRCYAGGMLGSSVHPLINLVLSQTLGQPVVGMGEGRLPLHAAASLFICATWRLGDILRDPELRKSGKGGLESRLDLQSFGSAQLPVIRV